MKTEDSKLLVGLLIGTVVGATIAYLATGDKKDRILEELGDLANKIKENYNNVVAKCQEKKQEIKEGIEHLTAE